jgi:hypothetical protein
VQQVLTDVFIDHPDAPAVEFGLLVLDPSHRTLLLDDGMFEAALEQGAWSGWRRLEQAGGTKALQVMLPEPAGTDQDLVFATRAVAGQVELAQAFFSSVRFRSGTLVGAPPRELAVTSRTHSDRPIESYQHLVRRIRAEVAHVVPPEATVVVVSKGDEALLRLPVRQAWHFPQSEDGRYAGHYPADSAAAIAHLEELRAQGGQYLLLPQPAFWWLEHYPEFAQHLTDHYRVVVRQEQICLLYALDQGQAAGEAVARR